MKRLILIFTLLFVVCNVNAGLLYSDFYFVHGKISTDRRWGGYEGQEITLTFFRMGHFVVSLECKELGFRYEFKDSQGGFISGNYWEDNWLCESKDGEQINSKVCYVILGNFYIQLQRPLSYKLIKPRLLFMINKSNNEPDLAIDVTFVEHKVDKTVESQIPGSVTTEEDWLYQMLKEYDKVENDTHDGEPELEIGPSYE